MTTTASDAFYRDMIAQWTTPDLVVLRDAFVLDRDAADSSPDCKAFCTERLRVIDAELHQRERAPHDR